MEHPDHLWVYSLLQAQADTRPDFHGWQLLGQTEVSDTISKTVIARRLSQESSLRDITFCGFSPHHAVRFQKRQQVLDFIICFHCGDFKVFYRGNYWQHGVLRHRTAVLERSLNTVLDRDQVKQDGEYLEEARKRKALPQ